MVVTCSRCGAKDDGVFCPVCGNMLNRVEITQEELEMLLNDDNTKSREETDIKSFLVVLLLAVGAVILFKWL